MSVLMKLAGGSPSLASQLNLDAFIEQARDYQAIGKTELGQILQAAQTEQLTHPVPVLRAKEIDFWASSQDYHHLLENHRKSERGWRNW